MFEWLSKEIGKDDRGFTLIELVVVIAIIAILVLIAVPKLVGTTDKAAKNAHNANVRTLESAATMFIADNPGQTATWTGDANQSWKDYVQKWPIVPKGAGTDKDGEKYEVTIDTKGTITVKPD